MKRFRASSPPMQAVLQRISTMTISSTAPSNIAMLKEAIVTHSGHFHCDEALAIGMLLLLPENHGRIIVRTRDMKIIDQAHMVVDVGAKFDVESRKFDHHQRGFEEVFGGPTNKRTKLSSAGLVYKYYGRRVITTLINDDAISKDNKIIDMLFEKIYTQFMESIDGIDNGIPACDGKPNYTVSTTLSSRVGYLNPSWCDVGVDENECFREACMLTVTEFGEHVERLMRDWLPARRYVEAAIQASTQEHANGRIIRLERACPWKDHLFDLEEEHDKMGHVTYVLYPDGPATTSNAYRVQAVPVKGDEFASRKALPERLRGLRDDALSQAAGVSGLVFVHAAGFIGGASDLEGARKLAELGLKE